MRDFIEDYPLVSIIIPAKNEENNIANCIDSVKKLDFPTEKIEVIVVDNGSIDNTVEIAKQLGAKVYIEKNATIASLRNIGVKKATGKFIAFIDADIIVLPTWLNSAIPYFNDQQIVCVGASPEVPEEVTWVEKIRYLNVVAQPEVWEANWICSMNMIVRESTFNEVGGFDERLITCEDVDIGYRIKKLKGNNKIIRDKRIRAIHVGEAKTLRLLFQKERWRAKSNFAGIKYHGLVAHEIPSLVFPLLNSILIVILIIAAIFQKLQLFIILLALILAQPILKTIRVLYKTKKYTSLFSVFIIQSVYAGARIASTFSNFINLFQTKKPRN